MVCPNSGTFVPGTCQFCNFTAASAQIHPATEVRRNREQAEAVWFDNLTSIAAAVRTAPRIPVEC